MSRGQRIGLLAAVVAIAVVAFVIAKPGSDDDNSDTNTQAASKGSKPSKPAKPPGPKTARIELKDHNPVGGSKVIKVKRDDRVLIVVTSDVADSIHLHGYDIEKEAGPSKPARFAFRAKNEGAYELESHHADEKIATLQVEPG